MKSSHEVFIDENDILRVVVHGQMHRVTTPVRIGMRLVECVSQLENKGVPVRIFLDYADAEKNVGGDLNVVLTAKGLMQIVFEKVAFVHMDEDLQEKYPELLQHLTADIQKKCRAFSDEKDAVAWLLMEE